MVIVIIASEKRIGGVTSVPPFVVRGLFTIISELWNLEGKCWNHEGGDSRVDGLDGTDCVGFDGWENEEWDINMSFREGNCNADTVCTLC
jgi:hypothetical protein